MIIFVGCLEGLCATSLMILQPQNQLIKSNFQRNASLQERHSRFKYVFIFNIYWLLCDICLVFN